MYKRIFSAALVFGAAALAPPLAAEGTTFCASRDAIVSELTGKFGETVVGGGLKNGSQLVEVWGSNKTGTFTVLMTYPDGTTCVLTSGKYWHATQPNNDVAG